MKRPISEIDSNVKECFDSSKKSKENGDNSESSGKMDRHSLEKELSAKIRLKKKIIMKKSKLFMCLDELKSFDKSLENNDKMEWTLPQFFIQDIQRVILFSLIGNQFRFYPRWCKILRPAFLKTVNLITINNVSEYDHELKKEKFKKFHKIFLNQKKELNSIEFVSSNVNGNDFLSEFVSVPITQTQWMKIRDQDEFKIKRNQVVKQYKALFEKMKNDKNMAKSETSDLDKIPRKSLLLNVVQMIREDYPLPFDLSNSDRVKEYVYSKESYIAVNNSSPLFSIDCEMCYNIDGEMEIVWLALANENLECIYETFVKPRRQIQNYLTHITGVNELHLKDITIDLSDVQRKIRELLPPDAILCGQSLNNDLHALKMFHPYVIDTSIIFNVSGNRDVKPSLRKLSAQFLGKLIQESTHNPVIDAKSSLQLVLLKLRQGLDFGDVIVNGCTNVYKDHVAMPFEGFDNSFKDNVASISKFIYQTGLNIEQNFFQVLIDNSIKSVYIDKEIPNKNFPKNFNTLRAEDNKKAFEKLDESLNTNKFTWTQFYVDNNQQNGLDDNELTQVLKYIKKIYKKLDDDSMLVVALTGRSEKTGFTDFLGENDMDRFNKLNRGRCFLTIKNLELEKMEKEIKELYDTVYPGGKKDDLGVILPEDNE
ncbi:RNA exonuclease NEF-sp isoform X2 [Brachionus plicatilis]|uniref:RNA exonuclease NEF-sp isoform X2 n=1 Tax=Brachionus plicatilis TaxID=10195 RepID=A0A3M7SD86_BRAPC|nr:RNA exonuclease NEF-sp isoform X2 [Brachionus plicatilis]